MGGGERGVETSGGCDLIPMLKGLPGAAWTMVEKWSERGVPVHRPQADPQRGGAGHCPEGGQTVHANPLALPFVGHRHRSGFRREEEGQNCP